MSAIRKHRTPSRPGALWIGFWSLFLALWCAGSAASESLQGEHVQVQWLVPEQFAADKPATIGIHFSIDPEWHLYWRNAGDSGAAPRFDFESNQVSVSEPLWPYPKRLAIAHLTNFGYEREVAYLFEVTPERLDDELTLSVDLEWLVCKVDCIPGFGTLTLTRPVAGSEHQWQSSTEATLARFSQRIPQESTSASWQIVTAQLQPDDRLALTLEGPDGAPAPEVFPLNGAFVSAAEPSRELTGQGVRLFFETSKGMDAPERLSFVLAAGSRAWAFDDVPVTSGVAENVGQPSPGIWWLLLSALIGGVLLNLMPCVFPVLSIKLFSLIRHQDGTPASAARRLREGLLYSAGVLTTFAALGALFLALRAAGAAVGWGFQLQSPVVVLALALLFWLMALSFMGAFQFGDSLVRLAGSQGGGGSAFGVGVLAVFVAAPCTGPFMGAALGASATLPAVPAMGVFIGLGAGLAAPFLLLAISPALSSRLPKPGPWMETLRQFLAFPLFATVLWLLWVLDRLLGEEAWLLGGMLLLAVSFAIWLNQSSRRLWRISALAVALLAGAWTFTQLAGTRPGETPEGAGGAWQPYDAQHVASAREAGKAVFIDFTAAWCVTCQVNKKRVLDTQAAQQLFRQHQVTLIRADWTRQDTAITDALAALGRNSVPVYVFYPPGGGQARILPQILTMNILHELFEN